MNYHKSTHEGEILAHLLDTIEEWKKHEIKDWSQLHSSIQLSLEHAQSENKVDNFVVGTVSPFNGKVTKGWPHIFHVHVTFCDHGHMTNISGPPLRHEIRSYLIDVNDVPGFMIDAADDYRATQIVEE